MASFSEKHLEKIIQPLIFSDILAFHEGSSSQVVYGTSAPLSDIDVGLLPILASLNFDEQREYERQPFWVSCQRSLWNLVINKDGSYER